MSDIFISYSSIDRDTAQMLARALEGEGWSVWWDRSILPGKTYDRVIEKELEAARCVIVIWTRESVESDWVRAEAGEALNRGTLVPVLREEVEIPLVFRQIHAAHLQDWDGDTRHPGFQQLLKAVAANAASGETEEVIGGPEASTARIDSLRRRALSAKSVDELTSVRDGLEELLSGDDAVAGAEDLRRQIERAIEQLSSSVERGASTRGATPAQAGGEKSTRSTGITVAAVALTGAVVIGAWFAYQKTGPEPEPQRQQQDGAVTAADQQAAQRRAEDEAAAQRAKEEAEQRLAQEQAAQRRAEVEAAAQRAKEEAAQRLAEEKEAARRQAELEAARLAEEEAVRRAEQDAAQRQAEQDAARRAEQEAAGRLIARDEAARREAEAEAERVRQAEEEASRQAALAAERRRVLEEQGRAERKQREIERLLAEAETAIARNRLSVPVDDNAVARYRAILSLDPDNPAARQGLIDVGNRYVELARGAMEEDRLDDARRYLAQAQSLLGDVEPVRTLSRDLATRSEQAAEARRAERETTRTAEPPTHEPPPPRQDMPLKIAIYRIETSASCNLPRDSQLLDIVTKIIDESDRLRLVYSYYDDDGRRLGKGTTGKIWKRREPDMELVSITAREMAADVVFIATLDCTDSPNIYDDSYDVEAYLVNVESGKLITKTGILRNMDIVARELFQSL